MMFIIINFLEIMWIYKFKFLKKKYNLKMKVKVKVSIINPAEQQVQKKNYNMN